MTLNKTLAALVVILVSVGFVGGLVVSSRMASPEAPAAPAAPEPPVEQARPIAGAASLPPAGTLPDLSSVAEAALRVATNISSTNVVRRSDPWSLFFYGEQAYYRAPSLGSGVIVSADGLILTNAHVIGNSSVGVKVRLFDGGELDAEIVGIDELSDLAVLKVNASNLPTLPWGDSSRLRVAEWVLAIGNPFQLSGTVTLGIVSTVSRSQSGGVTDFIQTDAAINPGNSGGALVNARGELVGINSQIYSETGGYQGIGFAIPSNLARDIMNELVASGSVAWGSIGYVMWIEPALARRVGLGNIDGLMVNEIGRNSAAYRAGLRPADVILTFNGVKPSSREELESLIARARAGTRATVEIQRDGKRLTLTVPIESRQSQQSLRQRAR
jgi:S1-C subfamily serine protease